jgi:hypothetical protein
MQATLQAFSVYSFSRLCVTEALSCFGFTRRSSGKSGTMSRVGGTRDEMTGFSSDDLIY